MNAPQKSVYGLKKWAMTAYFFVFLSLQLIILGNIGDPPQEFVERLRQNCVQMNEGREEVRQIVLIIAQTSADQDYYELLASKLNELKKPLECE